MNFVTSFIRPRSRQGKTGLTALVLAAALLMANIILATGEETAPPAKAAPAAQERPAPGPPPPTIPGATYIGSELCFGCHADAKAHLQSTPMGKIMLKFPRTEAEKRGCDACHGPSSKHIENPANKQAQITFGAKSAQPVQVQNQACIQCHDKGEHLWWKGSTHQMRGLACVRCHKIHSGEEKAALHNASTVLDLCAQCHPMRKGQTLRNSHMPVREGKLTCTDCHNPHGSNGPSLLTSKSINENCYRCHAEKRGPFLWEHPPVIENCDNCHEPHGSINPNLLRVKSGRLCQRCHVALLHPSFPWGARTRFSFGHGCANCHPQIHGSNHPSGQFFQR